MRGLGPLNVSIRAQTDDEIRLAQLHIRTAKILLQEIETPYAPPFVSRKIIAADGTQIAVSSNMNPLTGAATRNATITPPAARKKPKLDDRNAAPFIWIGLRDTRPDSSRVGVPFMTIWEPGTPEQRIPYGDEELGGQVLVPHPSAGSEVNPGGTTGVWFMPGSKLVQAPSVSDHQDTCANRISPMLEQERPGAVRFKPWYDFDGIGGNEGGLPPTIPEISTEAGLAGWIGGTDPVASPDDEDRENWVMSYMLDPVPGMMGDANTKPVTGLIPENQPWEKHGWPTRDKRDDDTYLSRSEKELLRGKPLPGKYLVKLGIYGPNYRPGQIMPYAGWPGSYFGSWVVPPIPVHVKIITGRGEYFKIQIFEYDLAVPNSRPEVLAHRAIPGWYERGKLGIEGFHPGHAIGRDVPLYNEQTGELVAYVPATIYFYGGRVYFGRGQCRTFYEVHDKGTPPALEDSLSQYEKPTFVIDPRAGAFKSDEPKYQPWGIPAG